MVLVCMSNHKVKGTECRKISSGSKDKRYKNKNINKNNNSKSSQESVAKNKSKHKQKGLKNKEKRKLNQASGNKESKNKNDSRKLFFSKSLLESKEVVNFIVDSGATDHIFNKSFIFSDKRCENGIIKSANKNEFSDIVTIGKGNLLL